MKQFERVVRFVMSGSVGAATNLGILYILVEFLHIYPVYASVVSFMCAVGVSFLLQKFWTFRNHDLAVAHVQATRFIIVALFNLACNALLMYAFIEGIGLHYLVAQVLTAGIVAVESFFVYKHVVFLNHTALSTDTE